MTNKLFLFFIVILLYSCKEKAPQETDHEEQLIISFYNLENLFDTSDDPKKQDNEFLPQGNYKWTQKRYRQKLRNISRVIKSINPDIIGLAEMENKEVLNDLLIYLPEFNYKIIHSESYDIRGIDVALLYKADKFSFYEKSDITSRLINGKYAGPRNILKVSLKIKSNQEKINFYINHWPSRRGGKEKNRIAFANELAKYVNNTHNSYIILGDFNDTPSNTSIKKLSNQLKNLYNPFSTINKKGTLSYKNKWYVFDQIMIDSSKIELKSFTINDFDYLKNQSSTKYNGYPLRTFVGQKYNPEGFSDHFPVSATIKLK